MVYNYFNGYISPPTSLPWRPLSIHTGGAPASPESCLSLARGLPAPPTGIVEYYCNYSRRYRHYGVKGHYLHDPPHGGGNTIWGTLSGARRARTPRGAGRQYITTLLGGCHLGNLTRTRYAQRVRYVGFFVLGGHPSRLPERQTLGSGWVGFFFVQHCYNNTFGFTLPALFAFCDDKSLKAVALCLCPFLPPVSLCPSYQHPTLAPSSPRPEPQFVYLPPVSPSDILYRMMHPGYTDV